MGNKNRRLDPRLSPFYENKVFLAFSTQKADWPKGADAEMDAEIQAAWDLVK
ncbi:MAG: hypothetical protein II520_00530 [Bacilli bacterium]|nr:hypothetical protein [Bacilli bacterium]